MEGARFGAWAARRPSELNEAPVTPFDTIQEDFASLDEWEDRYRYVIELGHDLEPLSEEAHNDVNKVRGCVSQVWLEKELRKNPEGETILHYRGDSDSHLVRGLIAIAIALYSDQTPKHIRRDGRARDLPQARPRAASDPAALERRALDDQSHPFGRCRPGVSRRGQEPGPGLTVLR